MEIKFEDIRGEFREANKKLQELKTVCYNVSTYDTEVNGESVPYRFVSFFDMAKEEMGTAILDHHGTALRDLADIPLPVMVAFAKYTEQVLAWQNGELPRPPFACTAEELEKVGNGRTIFEELRSDISSLNQEKPAPDKSHLVIEKREV